jgi:flagellar biosynthesis protein FlhG
VGKSVLAYNLADRAAAIGHRVLMIDADLSCGNLHILANVDPADGLDFHAVGQKTLAETTVTCKPGLDILARSNTGPLTALDNLTTVARWAERLRRDTTDYDLVILDHSSGISDTATILASASDINLLVAVPELTSISDCYGLCKYLYSANTTIECRLLINRTDSDEEADQVWTKFAAMTEQFLAKVPGLAGSIQETGDIRRSVAHQRSIAAVAPESTVLQRLDAIISDLVAAPAAITTSETNSEINYLTATADIRE